MVYKLIKKHKFRNFVEIGMGNGTRAVNLIRVAQKFSSTPGIRYTGVDLFEARPEGEPLQLIKMHRTLKADSSVKSQLVPGGTKDAIPRIANSHVRTDMILISAGHDSEALVVNMTYLPRMLHSESLVLVQTKPNRAFEVFNRLDIEKLAGKPASKAKRAA